MSIWSSRRQFWYAVLILIILGIIGLAIYAKFFIDPANCFDGIKNQREINIDCGGECAAVCREEVTDFVTIWTKPLPSRQGAYHVAAYIENPNVVGMSELDYRFKMYDKDHILVKEVRGTTFANPDERFVLFAPAIEIGSRLPTYAFLDLQTKTAWQRFNKEGDRPRFSVSEKILTTRPLPRVEAMIKNTSLFATENVEVVAIVYDSKNNAIGGSRTVIDRLGRGESQKVVFTWPGAFLGEASFVEIYPRVNRFILGR